MGGQRWRDANINKHCTRKLVLCRDRITDETFTTTGPNIVGYWASLARYPLNFALLMHAAGKLYLWIRHIFMYVFYLTFLK